MSSYAQGAAYPPPRETWEETVAMITRCGAHQVGLCASWEEIGDSGTRLREAPDSDDAVPAEPMGDPGARGLGDDED